MPEVLVGQTIGFLMILVLKQMIMSQLYLRISKISILGNNNFLFFSNLEPAIFKAIENINQS